MPPSTKDYILHSTSISGNIVIMASDLNQETPLEGNAVHLCVNCKSEEELNTILGLSKAGKVNPSPACPGVQKYGALTDKFGKH